MTHSRASTFRTPVEFLPFFYIHIDQTNFSAKYRPSHRNSGSAAEEDYSS